MKSNLARRVLIALVGMAGFAWAAGSLLSAPPQLEVLEGVQAIDVNLTTPDAWVDSSHLSSLPRAIVKAPLLRELLTEEAAFYYESLQARLDAEGTIKRLAYERDLTLSDRLIDSIFDGPAEVAFWRAEDGRPRYWMLRFTRNGLAKAMEEIAKIGIGDSELTRVGKIALGAGEEFVYALKLSSLETLLLVSHGDQMLVLSHPGLLLDDKGQPRPDRAGFIRDSVQQPLDKESPFAARFNAGPRQGEHRITLGAGLMGFGYEHFFPLLKAMRFEHTLTGWQTGLRVEPIRQQAWSKMPWAALPHDAAYCTALPVSNSAIQAMLASHHALSAKLAGLLSGEAAACWYREGGWQAPLIAARLNTDKPDPEQIKQLGKLFGAWIGTREFELPEDNPGNQRFPVTMRSSKHGATLWQRPVSARYGDTPVPAKMTEQFSGANYFNVSLALAGDTLLFSLSDKLVDKALSTVDRQYPAMAERLPAGRAVLMTLDSPRLGGFLDQSTRKALPAESEPVLRGIADRQLLPRYAMLAKQPSVAAALMAPSNAPGDSAHWLTVDWLPLK